MPCSFNPWVWTCASLQLPLNKGGWSASLAGWPLAASQSFGRSVCHTLANHSFLPSHGPGRVLIQPVHSSFPSTKTSLRGNPAHLMDSHISVSLDEGLFSPLLGSMPWHCMALGNRSCLLWGQNLQLEAIVWRDTWRTELPLLAQTNCKGESLWCIMLITPALWTGKQEDPEFNDILNCIAR